MLFVMTTKEKKQAKQEYKQTWDKHKLCPVCGLRLINKPFKGYSRSMCWICYLKSVGFYKLAIEEIKNGWFNWWTKWDFQVGWSFVMQLQFCKLHMCILKSENLNKTPKIPKKTTPQDYDWSDWHIKITNGYYAKFAI